MDWLKLHILALWLLPAKALAGSSCSDGSLSKLNVSCIFGESSGGIGTDLTPGDIILNIADTLLRTIGAVASAIFITGAFLYIISFEKEERKNQGKEFMIGALIGIAIVVGAKGILNTVLYFLFPS